VHLLVVGIISLCLFALFLDADAGLIQAMGRDATLTGRTKLWAQLYRMSVNPWFGVGFESFWLGERVKSVWETYWWRPNQAHNGYLEIFLDLGWIGVALLSFVMFWGYRNIVRSLRRDPELGRLKLALFVVAVLYNLTEAAFMVMNPVLFAFLLAIIVIPDPPRRRMKPFDERRALPDFILKVEAGQTKRHSIRLRGISSPRAWPSAG
jgi:O-antigen ligase